MGHAYHDIAFTDAVKSIQEERGSRTSYARFEGEQKTGDRIGPDEAAFISARDSFYMASTSSTGWPYLQHRGGPVGFMRILDHQTLGFADFSGNKQFVSLGNMAGDDRVSLFFMDYANRARLKVFGHASVIHPADEETLAKLAVPGYRARVERGISVRVSGLDWNCPQHITRRFSEAQVSNTIEALESRIKELEDQLSNLA